MTKGTDCNQFTQKSWHVVYTRYRYERKVQKELDNLGIESFLPSRKVVRQWSDRKKVVENLIFPSYVFLRSCEKEYYKVLSIKGLVRFVIFDGKPSKIPEWQIDALRKITSSGIRYSCLTQSIPCGEKVKIISGPLCGTYGEVIKGNQNQIRIIIDGISNSLIINTSSMELARIGCL